MVPDGLHAGGAKVGGAEVGGAEGGGAKVKLDHVECCARCLRVAFPLACVHTRYRSDSCRHIP